MINESREGGLGVPTRHPLGQDEPTFWDEAELNRELERVYDICHGCRRCVSLCNAFPTLFDLVDESATMEVDGVAAADYGKVVEQCFLCDLCYLTKCPYVPPHEWNVDFPHLMLRAKAVAFRKGKAKFRDRLITSTDLIGKTVTGGGRGGVVGAIAATVANKALGNRPLRKLLHKTLGIHQDAPLPTYARQPARARPGVSFYDPQQPVDSATADPVGAYLAATPMADAGSLAVRFSSEPAAPAIGKNGPATAMAAGTGAADGKATAMAAGTETANGNATATAAGAGAANGKATASGAEAAADTAANGKAVAAKVTTAIAAGVKTADTQAAGTEAAAAKAAKAKVALFTSCYCNYNEPDISASLIAVLEHNGVEVVLPSREHCCGMPKLELGDLDSVAKLKAGNIPTLAALAEAGYALMAPVPSCVLMFKQELPLMFPADAAVRAVADAFHDPFEFLHKRHKAGALRTDFQHSLGHISYHVACHQRVQNIGPRTKQILELVPGTQVTAIERCAGHDGTYGVKGETRQFANAIAAPVARQLGAQSADHFGSDCPLAGRHLENRLAAGKPTTHPVDLLRMAYGI